MKLKVLIELTAKLDLAPWPAQVYKRKRCTLVQRGQLLLFCEIFRHRRRWFPQLCRIPPIYLALWQYFAESLRIAKTELDLSQKGGWPPTWHYWARAGNTPGDGAWPAQTNWAPKARAEMCEGLFGGLSYRLPGQLGLRLHWLEEHQVFLQAAAASTDRQLVLRSYNQAIWHGWELATDLRRDNPWVDAAGTVLESAREGEDWGEGDAGEAQGEHQVGAKEEK